MWGVFFVRGVFLGHSRAHLGPGVHHIHEVAAGIGPQDGLQHLFVLQAASAEARQRLAAAADGGLGGGERLRLHTGAFAPRAFGIVKVN